MSLAPPTPLAGGTTFWENLSLESLVEEDLFLLIGRAAGAAGSDSATRPPPPSTPADDGRPRVLKRAKSTKRPTSIALPSPPRMPAAGKPASPLSPKLYGWNFLRRNNGASSGSGPQGSTAATTTASSKTSSAGLPANRQVEVASAPRRHRTSLALPQGTTFDLEEARLKVGAAAGTVTRPGGPVASASASSSSSAVAVANEAAAPARPVRPGQSRSSTWTDNLPTVRTLNHGLDVVSPPALPHPPLPSSAAVVSPSADDPFGEDPVLLVPIVSPRKDNVARGGRFGLFRRGSLSPRVEKTGFTIGGRPSEDGGGSSSSSSSKHRKKALKDAANMAGLPARKHRGSFGSFTSLGNRPGSPLSWAPRAEELRHVALTTASPPPEEANSVDDFEPGSLSSDAASLRSYFTAAPQQQQQQQLAHDVEGRRGSLPRSTLHGASDLHQLAQSPVLAAASASTSPAFQSPLRQSIDLPPPHVKFGGPPAPASPLRTSAPAFARSQHSDSSLSLQTSAVEDDSDEDFPTRAGARKAVKATKLRKAAHVKVGRERSCSPLRYASDVDGTESQGEDGRGRLKAWQWWRPTSPAGGARARPTSTILGSSVPAPSSEAAADRGKRGKPPAPSRVSLRGFKVLSRPVSTFDPVAAAAPALGFPPTPPPSDPSPTPTPALTTSTTREPSPGQPADSLLAATRPAAFSRQSTGGVSVRGSVVLRDWQPPAKSAPTPPDAAALAQRAALPPVDTSAVPRPSTTAARKDSLSPPSGSSYDGQSPTSAYGTATEGDDTALSEQEVATTEDGSFRQAWRPQPKIWSAAESERSGDSDSILHRVESHLGGPAASKA